jgi:hypothetical protein
MRHLIYSIGFLCCLAFCSCGNKQKDNAILSRTFENNSWERFDYVHGDVTITEPTTYDLSLKIEFSENYSYDNFSMNFTVFDKDQNPYRARDYMFRLKDASGAWKSELKDGGYTFVLPINKELLLNESGTYRFQLENKMPITPLYGIKKIELFSTPK